MRVCVCLGAILISEYLDFHSGYSAPRSRIAGRGRIMMLFFSLLTNITLGSGDSVEAVEKRKGFWWSREGTLGNNRILHIRFYCAVRSLYLWYLLRMPGMDAPRALVSRPLVKGSEALGTRLPSPLFCRHDGTIEGFRRPLPFPFWPSDMCPSLQFENNIPQFIKL